MRYTRRTTGGKEILLRPFTVQDMKDKRYIAAFDDPAVTRLNSHGLFPYTKTRQEEFARELESSTSRVVFAVVVREDVIREVSNDAPMPSVMNAEFANYQTTMQKKVGVRETMIGNCSLQSINWVNRSAEFAIVIWDVAHWGEGIATIAAEVCLEHAFMRLGMRRVWSGTARENVGMQHVFRKTGFKLEGTFRKGTFLNGDWQDVLCYGLLSEEYFSYRKEK